jgi:hypothetical protein
VFDFPKNARTIISDTTNAATKVAEYLSKDAAQVDVNTSGKAGATIPHPLLGDDSSTWGR